MKVVLYVIVAVVQLAAYIVGRVEVSGFLKVIIPEYQHNTNHFQQQK